MLATSIGGVDLSCCIYNASGPRSGREGDLVAIGKSCAGAVLSKSATLESRTGNDRPRLKPIDSTSSINSEGLPNSGIDYYISDKVINAVKATGKPYFVSLSGLKLANNLTMLTRIAEAKANGAAIEAVELNLACPNIPGKPTVAYDFAQMRDILQQVLGHRAFAASGLPLGVKLAPYFDMTYYDQACNLINTHADRIAFVTTVNTIGNALFIDAETEMALIAPKHGFGGLGGSLVKQVALANVRQLYTRLDRSIDIVGVGGVASGEDAFELILCGAKAVQTATTHWLEGPSCFDRIASELKAIMRRKGYSSIEDFRGKLKDFDRSLSKKAVKGQMNVQKNKSSNGAGAWPMLCAVLFVALLGFLVKEAQSHNLL